MPRTFTSQSTLFWYATSITFFILGFSIKTKEGISKLDSLVNDVKNLINYLNTHLIEIKDEVKKANTLLTEKNEDDAKILVINSSEDLYSLLTEKIKTAKERVLIMHLDPHSPDYHQNDARSDYFKFVFEFIEKHGEITMRRITSLPEREKAEWLKTVMEKEINKIEKLDIAYINIENLEKNLENNEGVSTVVSCQIIDEDKIFILNPLWNTVLACGECGECLYIESKKVVKVYERYFDTLWGYARTKSKGCCILKRGRECDFESLKKIIGSLPESQPFEISCDKSYIKEI
jgi:hypothetical protein